MTTSVKKQTTAASHHGLNIINWAALSQLVEPAQTPAEPTQSHTHLKMGHSPVTTPYSRRYSQLMASAAQTPSFKPLHSIWQMLTNTRSSGQYVLLANTSTAIIPTRFCYSWETVLSPPACKSCSLDEVHSLKCTKMRWTWAVLENPKKTFSSELSPQKQLLKGDRGAASVHVFIRLSHEAVKLK